MLDFLTAGPKFVAHVSYASDELHRPPMHGFAAACNLLLLSMLSQDKQMDRWTWHRFNMLNYTQSALQSNQGY